MSDFSVYPYPNGKYYVRIDCHEYETTEPIAKLLQDILDELEETKDELEEIKNGLSNLLVKLQSKRL